MSYFSSQFLSLRTFDDLPLQYRHHRPYVPSSVQVSTTYTLYDIRGVRADLNDGLSTEDVLEVSLAG